MEQLVYLLPAFVMMLGITFAYEAHRRRVQRPVVSRSVVTWVNLLILITATTLAAGMTVQDVLSFVAFTGAMAGIYLFIIRPRVSGKNE